MLTLLHQLVPFLDATANNSLPIGDELGLPQVAGEALDMSIRQLFRLPVLVIGETKQARQVALRSIVEALVKCAPCSVEPVPASSFGEARFGEPQSEADARLRVASAPGLMPAIAGDQSSIRSRIRRGLAGRSSAPCPTNSSARLIADRSWLIVSAGRSQVAI